MELRLLTFIGPDSVTAAGVLLAAGQQNKLWNATDLFYRNQGEENSGYVTDDFLTKVLTGAGADAEKAIAGAGDPAVSQEIAAAKTLSQPLRRHRDADGPRRADGRRPQEVRRPRACRPRPASASMVDAALAAKGGQ